MVPSPRRSPTVGSPVVDSRHAKTWSNDSISQQIPLFKCSLLEDILKVLQEIFAKNFPERARNPCRIQGFTDDQMKKVVAILVPTLLFKVSDSGSGPDVVEETRTKEQSEKQVDHSVGPHIGFDCADHCGPCSSRVGHYCGTCDCGGLGVDCCDAHFD